MFKSLQRIINKWWKATKFQAKGTVYIAVLVTAVLIIFVIVQFLMAEATEHREIVLEDSPIEIEDVRLKGEIYVCSAIIEDYVTVQKTEKHLGVIPENHSCIQIMRQKCSYMIDLDKVVYTPDSNRVVYVRIPKPEYVASTQNTPFISDDEEYWINEMPSTNKLKQKVEWKIRARFETPENKRKAMRYAEDAIANMLEKLGYHAEFISTIDTHKESPLKD